LSRTLLVLCILIQHYFVAVASVLTRFYLGRYDGKTGIRRFPEIMGRSEKLRGKKMNYSVYENVLGLGPYAMFPGTIGLPDKNS